MRLSSKKFCRNIYTNLPSELLGRSKKINLQKGDSLYLKNENPKGFYFIESGLLALTDISPNGAETLLRIFSNDFFIGYRTFCEGGEYHASASALSDSIVYRLDFESLEDVQDTYPEVLMHLVKMLSIDLRISEERFNDLTGKRAMSRIIDSLIFLKQRQPGYQWTRREVGEFCGAKTETVTRSFSKLESVGLINKDGRDVQVPNFEKLLNYKDELDLEG